MLMATTRFLTLDELTKAPIFSTVWDKSGNKFFRLTDGAWAAEDLSVTTSEALFKLKVKVHHLRQERI